MNRNIVNAANIPDMEYTALVELLRDIYCKEIPECGINQPPDLGELEKLTVFFSNQYSYMVELWSIMVYQVRLLKRISKNKDTIDDAMSKRDYLEKVMSAVKLKYYSASRLLKHCGEQNYEVHNHA